MRITFSLFVSLVTASIALGEPKSPTISEMDRIRIAEAFRLADAIGNRVWPNWDKAPFAVLLVTADHEFLIRHPKPSDDFVLVGEDALLKSKVWQRPRKFQKELLATFPAVGGIPTIVIGQAENTEAKTSTRWVITLLHEHFHQLQSSQPKYYVDVDSLGLARGDMTGMWMLNYPFPYEKPEVKEQFSVMAQALAQALKARQQPDFADRLGTYLESRKKFRSLLQADDYKYFAFQVWQEGIARYTECQLAELAADSEPSKAFRELKDYRSYKDTAGELLSRLEKDLASVQLDKAKRTAVYSFGAAEGLLLDRIKPEWRKQYFEEKFTLDNHFRAVK